MTDEDLRALERSARLAPGDLEAGRAHARALERLGRRDEHHLALCRLARTGDLAARNALAAWRVADSNGPHVPLTTARNGRSATTTVAGDISFHHVVALNSTRAVFWVGGTAGRPTSQSGRSRTGRSSARPISHDAELWLLETEVVAVIAQENGRLTLARFAD
jgi:hypothetical protein